MSNLTPILKALVMQARFNSQLIISLGLLSKSLDLGPEYDKFSETVTAAYDNNKELIDILDNMIDKMLEKSNA
jgi:hypothetical protein